MFEFTLEQEILLNNREYHFLSNKYHAAGIDSVLHNHNRVVKLVSNMQIYSTDPDPYEFYDSIIKRRLPEALLSPVGWIRSRAAQLEQES